MEVSSAFGSRSALSVLFSERASWCTYLGAVAQCRDGPPVRRCRRLLVVMAVSCGWMDWVRDVTGGPSRAGHPLRITSASLFVSVSAQVREKPTNGNPNTEEASYLKRHTPEKAVP